MVGFRLEWRAFLRRFTFRCHATSMVCWRTSRKSAPLHEEGGGEDGKSGVGGVLLWVCSASWREAHRNYRINILTASPYYHIVAVGQLATKCGIPRRAAPCMVQPAGSDLIWFRGAMSSAAAAVEYQTDKPLTREPRSSELAPSFALDTTTTGWMGPLPIVHEKSKAIELLNPARPLV